MIRGDYKSIVASMLTIKKLTGLKPGEGHWRLSWRDYRPRYDIFGSEVVLHSFRNRKGAY